MDTMPPQRRAIGLIIGAWWLVAVSAGFAVLSLVMIHTRIAMASLAIVIATVAGFAGYGVGYIRAMLRRGPLPPQSEKQRRVMRWFGWIVVAEVLAIWIVNALAAVTNRIILIPALDLVVVGLHFLPLAALFRVRRYYATGVLFVTIPVVILLAIPSAARIGDVQAWWVLPSLGCGLVAVATSAASFREARQLIDALHSQQGINERSRSTT